MKVSVVFATYNSPDWLEKVLWGFSCQTHCDFKIVIADDGSTEETARLIDRMREETGLDIRHVWQEDDGFRKCRILNKALLHVDTEYVVLTDGDCIPRWDFLHEHVANAERGYYLSGSYFKLPMETSKAISKADILDGRCFDVKWLRNHGLTGLRKTWKISSSARRARLFNRLTTTPCNFKGANASVWMSDVMKVNGFDERMRYGGLDREFGVRLLNSGIKARHVRYNAICLHLDHRRDYRDPKLLAANRALRLAVDREDAIITEFGIQQLLDTGYKPAGA